MNDRCDNCRQTLDIHNAQALVFDNRIHIVCAACHERLANVIAPIHRLRQMEACLRE